ncbi:pyridoxine 5'-phosphate synthase [Helicobacter cetorum]|uniref:Pyridoxine 5'-phosphate synthase n=1 Tax=Helicobacter cetorum (strain ATCC BAA-429 / MIT 00-7128) TaxID=182217 RepID=I0ELE3_HELC0|nr:pyridoxine 5'-phosphate synthase [Helicobacter cetorum]AFI03762.1 pyridoxine 5'-phosphate synthase [Helicobacter cetorum MIT 00-7128]
MRFGLNIDHIVTLREVRKTYEPEILEALLIAKNTYKVDLITIHLREDRRHIQNEDVLKLLENSLLPINIECSINANITDFLCSLKNKPSKVTIVPENRAEITTEGGLDCSLKDLPKTIKAYQNRGIEVSLFIDPNLASLKFAQKHGVKQVEFHTGVYANLHNALYSNANHHINAINALREKTPKELKEELQNAFLQLRKMSKEAFFMGIEVCAGHGLNYSNVKEMLKIPSLRELNIGHSVISRAVFVGLEKAILEMAQLIKR